jgi:hypothetical protein
MQMSGPAALKAVQDNYFRGPNGLEWIKPKNEEIDNKNKRSPRLSAKEENIRQQNQELYTRDDCTQKSTFKASSTYLCLKSP